LLRYSCYSAGAENKLSNLLAVGAVCGEPVSLLLGQYQRDFHKKQRTWALKFAKRLWHKRFSIIPVIQ
jgi:hypothetical protein